MYYRSKTQCSLEHPRALSMIVWSEGVSDAILLNSLSHVSERDSRIPVHITRDLTSGGILQIKKNVERSIAFKGMIGMYYHWSAL